MVVVVAAAAAREACWAMRAGRGAAAIGAAKGDMVFGGGDRDPLWRGPDRNVINDVNTKRELGRDEGPIDDQSDN